jgi:hypothetical protein
MLETELHLSPDKAEMLMKIARKFGHLTDSADLRNLPASRTTLFEMTKLDMKVLEAKLKDGTFNADTERKDVIKLLPKPKKAKPRKAKVITPTEEITGAPTKPTVKPMPAWERLRLYVRDIRSELVKELTDDPSPCPAIGPHQHRPPARSSRCRPRASCRRMRTTTSPRCPSSCAGRRRYGTACFSGCHT